jgi:signal peptidase I
MSEPAAGLVTDSPPLDAANGLIQERLHSGQTVRFTIPTTSMLPFLEAGDSVVVRASSVQELVIGDIVVAKLDGRMVAHRLIALRAEGGNVWATTKGDNTPRADKPWPAAKALGMVTAVRSNGRERDLGKMSARTLSRALALLSRSQWAVYRLPPSPLKSMALPGLGKAVRAFGRITRGFS